MKTPKIVKGMKLVKALVRKGFKIKSRNSSHVSLTNGRDHVTVVLPITTIGVLKKICRITGISGEELNL